MTAETEESQCELRLAELASANQKLRADNERLRTVLAILRDALKDSIFNGILAPELKHKSS